MGGLVSIAFALSLQYPSLTVQASIDPELFRTIGVEEIEWRNGKDSICGCPETRWPW